MSAGKRLPGFLLHSSSISITIRKVNRRRLREVYDELARWDHRSTNDSVAMTLFSLWHDRVSRDENTENPVGSAHRGHQCTWSVILGRGKLRGANLSRLQRIDESKGEDFRTQDRVLRSVVSMVMMARSSRFMPRHAGTETSIRRCRWKLRQCCRVCAKGSRTLDPHLRRERRSEESTLHGSGCPLRTRRVQTSVAHTRRHPRQSRSRIPSR